MRHVNETDWDRDTLAIEAAARVRCGELSDHDNHSLDFAAWALALLQENDRLRAERTPLVEQLRQACSVAFEDLIARGMPPSVSTGELLRAAITAAEAYLGQAAASSMEDKTAMTAMDLFATRPAWGEVCFQCKGHGKICVSYALHPLNVPLEGAPEDAVRAFIGGSFDVFTAAREAAELARSAKRPVAFQCLDHLVIVGPHDDPEQVARAWWLKQYRETPEVSRARQRFEDAAFAAKLGADM